MYTTLTSVDPLRIHVHHSDILLRFCPEKYHPFDAANKNKYVVQDDYLPAWKVPSLSKYYNDLGFSFKDTLQGHIHELGKDPEAMWNQMYATITDVYKSQEEMFIKAVSHYPHKSAFFEMVRFDFVVDEDLNVYLMEANMSPNLSSAHFPPNRLLYEQVIHSVLRLVGVYSMHYLAVFLLCFDIYVILHVQVLCQILSNLTCSILPVKKRRRCRRASRTCTCSPTSVRVPTVPPPAPCLSASCASPA